MKKNKFSYLLGKSKFEVLEELGEGFSNFYSEDIWLYQLEKIWWLRENILFLEFEESHLKRVHVKRVYCRLYI